MLLWFASVVFRLRNKTKWDPKSKMGLTEDAVKVPKGAGAMDSWGECRGPSLAKDRNDQIVMKKRIHKLPPT